MIIHCWNFIFQDKEYEKLLVVTYVLIKILLSQLVSRKKNIKMVVHGFYGTHGFLETWILKDWVSN